MCVIIKAFSRPTINESSFDIINYPSNNTDHLTKNSSGKDLRENSELNRAKKGHQTQSNANSSSILLNPAKSEPLFTLNKSSNNNRNGNNKNFIKQRENSFKVETQKRNLDRDLCLQLISMQHIYHNSDLINQKNMNKVSLFF